MSVFGALTMYMLSMISLFRLRRTEPTLVRSYKAPLYPVLPGFALVAALIALAVVIYYNIEIFFIYSTIMLVCTVFFMSKFKKE
jgi:ethanolamine permease